MALHAPVRSGDGYQPALDGLRAFAALSVVGFHLQLPGFQAGYLGVDIFFVLSGFLITRILLRSIALSGRVDYKAFYVRRILRLLPAYLVVVAVAAVADHFIDVGGTLKGAVVSFFYVANWADGIYNMGLGSLGHTWSLSIEEQFYVIWPALLAFGVARWGRRTRGPVTYIAGGIFLGYTAMLVAVVLGAPERLIHNATPFRATELLAGCLLAVTFGRIQVNTRTAHVYYGPVCLVGLIAMIAFDGFGGPAAPLLIWPLVSLLTCGLICALCFGGAVARAFSLRPIVAIGTVSYGIYLWHFPVVSSIDEVWGLNTVAPRVLAILVTAVLVPLCYFFVEKPFLRLKSRFDPRWTPSPERTSPLSGPLDSLELGRVEGPEANVD